MSAGRISPGGWITGLGLLLAAGFAGWAWNERRQAAAEVADLLQSQATLAADLKRAQAVVDGAKRAAAAKAAAASAPAPAAAPPKARPDIGALLSAHPDLLAAFIKGIRGYTEQSYGALFSRLHLSPGQIDQLETLIVNGLENNLDLQSTAQAQGLANDDPVIKKERDQQAADLLAAEQALLGPDAYEAFHSATRAEALRGAVEQVAAMTQFSTTPMTGEQSQQLVQLMAQASGDYRDGKDASVNTVDWDTVMAQAPGFLTPTQVATLQGVAQENRFHVLAKQFDAQEAPAQQVGN